MTEAKCAICKGEMEILYNRGIVKRGIKPAAFDNFICKNCGLVCRDKTKKVIPGQYVEECYGLKGEDEVAKYFEHIKARSKNKINIEFIKRHLKPGTRCLEIGSGFGLMQKDIADLGYSVKGVEPATSGRYAAKKLGLPVFEGALDDFLAQAGGEKFDFILMHHVFEHFEDPAAVLEGLDKILASGGLLYIEVPNILNFDRRPDDFFDFWHYYNYSPKTLQKMLYKGGFKIININQKKPARIQIIAARQNSGEPEIFFDEKNSYERIKRYIAKKKIVAWFAGPKRIAKKIKDFLKKHKTESLLASASVIMQSLAFWITASHGNFLDISDAETYFRVGKNLIKYGGFFYNPATMDFFAEMPLFPLFVSIFYFIIPKIWFVIIAQNFIAVLSVIVVFNLGKDIFNKKIAWLAAVIFIIDSQRLYFANQAMSETLFTFFNLLMALFLVKFEMLGRKKHLVLGAFFLGLSVLTRPTTQYFILFLVGYLAIRGLLNKSFKKYFFYAFLIFLVYGATIAPWLIRNKIHFGQIKSTSVGEFNLYAAYAVYFLEYKYKGQISEGDLYLFTKGKFIRDVERGVFEGKAEPVEYEYTPTAMKEALRSGAVPIPPQYNYYNPKYGGYYLKEFLKIISIDYFAAAKLYIKESIKFLIDSGFSKSLARMTKNIDLPPKLFYPYLWWGERIFWASTYLTIFSGLFMSRQHLKNKIKPISLIFLIIFYFTAISAFTNPGEFPRYRLPIAPFIYLLFSYSIFAIIDILKTRKKLL